MKRVGIFLLVGPLLGFVLALILTVRVSPPRPSIHVSSDFLPFAYLASLVLSGISAGVDLSLVGRSWKLYGTTAAGAMAAVLGMLLLLHGQTAALQLPAFALLGAIPAAVCSWL